MSEKPTDIFGAIEITTEKQAAKMAVKSTRSSKKKKKVVQKKKRSGAKGLIWLGTIIFLFGCYSAAGYLLVPYLLKTVLSDSLKENVSIVLTTEKIKFNPFNFRLDIQELSLETIEDGQSAEQLLNIKNLKADLDFLSLLRGDLVCISMDINGLDLRITRNQDKTYNISYLLRRNSLQDQSDIIDFAELPFLFSFNNIKVSDSRIIIYDRITQKDHLIDEIELAFPVISNFDFKNKFYIQPRFSAVVNGSPVTLTGEAAFGTGGRQSKQTQLSCDLNDIDIPLYFDYLPVDLPVDITEGKAKGKLQLTFSPEQEKGGKIIIQFSLTTSSLSVESRDGKLKLSVPEANFAGTLEPFSNTIFLQNVLFREPSIISNGEMTRDTLASLVPLTVRPDPEDHLHQIIPSLSIKLLIADGGTYRVINSDKKKSKNWDSLQLSIKNFSNERSKSSEMDSSFRLSGEHQASAAFFTWQGTFDKRNQPVGNLQLNAIPAALVAPFLGRKSSDISGITEINGLLNIVLSDKADIPFDYSLKSTRVTIKELRLKDQGVVWLHTPVFRSEPVSKISGITDLGNIFLPNSTVVINREKLPYLFQTFASQSAQHVLHGIDFSGTVKIGGTKKTKPLLDLKSVIFQANKLEQQELQKDNFIFSAQLKESEDIQAKGSLHIAPLQITTQLSADNLSPRQFLSWFSNSKTFLTSQGLISFKGAFQFPQQDFSGEVTTRKLLIGDPAKPVLQAEKLNLIGFTWSKANQNLHIKELLIDQPEIIWQQRRKDQNPVSLASIFLRHIFLPEPDSTAKDPDISLSRFAMAIDQIGITDGAISYRDERTVPPLTLGLTGINGNLQGIRYPVAPEDSAITLTGNIEGHPFNLGAKGNLMQSPPSARVSFSSTALPLELFTKQIDKKIKGINVSPTTADISYSAVWEPVDSGMQATLVLNKLAPVKSGTAAATSLAVLSGVDGSISAEFRSDAGKEPRPLLNQALDHFARLMIKASLNPLLVSGPDFKDLVDATFVSFAPGSDYLSPESIEQLNRYGQFLATHPLINLQITGFSDQAVDTAVLKSELMAIEKKRINEDNRARALEFKKKQAAEEAMRTQKALAKGAKGSAIQESDLAPKDVFVPAAPRMVVVTKKMLSGLAEKREQTVINYFTQKLSLLADRVINGSQSTRRVKNEGNFARALIVLTDGFKLTKAKEVN